MSGFTDDDAFIAVGDGATPRTAALFAFLSKAGTCFAVDPLLENTRCSKLGVCVCVCVYVCV